MKFINRNVYWMRAVEVVLLTVLMVGLTTVLPGQEKSQSEAKSRTYRMGFGIMPPRPGDVQLALKGFELWSQHADAAIQHQEVPWAKLLKGADPEELIKEELLKLIEGYRSKKLTVAITVECLNGLDRAAEAKELVDAKRSIKEEEIRKLYTKYVLALAKLTKPDYLGLAAEVNLFQKENGDSKTYHALVSMVNEAAKELKKAFPKLPLYVSVQVDIAWGCEVLNKDKPKYVGVEDVFKDYPFMDVLGLSSYPVFGWSNPDKIPKDYFSRLVKEHNMPVILVEGGWASKSTPAFKTSEALQARWVKRLGELLNEAEARFAGLLLFTDLDMKHFPKDTPEILQFFSSLGFVDKDLKPKPALKEWDRIFERPYRPLTEAKSKK